MAACIARAAQIIANAAKQSRCVTVVSAMSEVTNRLIDAAKKAEAGNADEAAAILDALRRQHETALADLIRQEEERTRIRRRIQALRCQNPLPQIDCLKPIGIRRVSLAIVWLDSSSQTQNIKLVFQPFENSSLSELESFQSARKPIDILRRTTDGNLQPRNRSVAVYHWNPLHLLHFDSCISVVDWSQMPANKTAEVQTWQRLGQFLSSW